MQDYMILLFLTKSNKHLEEELEKWCQAVLHYQRKTFYSWKW